MFYPDVFIQSLKPNECPQFQEVESWSDECKGCKVSYEETEKIRNKIILKLCASYSKIVHPFHVISGISDDLIWSDICLQQLKVLSLGYSEWSTSECWLEHFSTLGCGITGCIVTSNSICTNIMRDDGQCLRCISHIRRFGVNSKIGMPRNRLKTVLEAAPDRLVYQIYPRHE
jgi:hypothetical protein